MKIQGKVTLDHRVYNIPNDIISEILLRLPAKSLIRFRWACKYWFDLITRSPDFIKMHLLRHSTTTTTHNDDDDEILMRSISSSSIVLSISYRNGVDDSSKLFQSSLDYNDATGVGDLSSEVCIAIPFDRPGGCRLQIVGSCNGLILLYQDLNEIFCIWNPCTKEYRILPHPPSIGGFQLLYRYYGFGYDHTTDDYKVIIRNIYDNFRIGDYDLRLDVQVYTLGTNSWRKLVDGGPNLGKRFGYYQKEGLFVNGALYWIDTMNKDIVSFDIEKEKFRHVSKIPNLTGHDDCWNYVRMRVFEGCLCLVINDQLNFRKEIWVMKEYAVNNNNNESLWTKLSAIPYLDDCYLSPLNPLRFTRNGEILMVTNKYYLRLYDPKNSNVESICSICEHLDRRCFIDVYTESLVSLNSGTYMALERMKKNNKKKNQTRNKNQTKNKNMNKDL